jgi:hypothetical protein
VKSGLLMIVPIYAKISVNFKKLKFIQLGQPLPPLKPMAQSRRGVIQNLEA